MLFISLYRYNFNEANMEDLDIEIEAFLLKKRYQWSDKIIPEVLLWEKIYTPPEEPTGNQF